jgi:PAS domain S-box-containing protein
MCDPSGEIIGTLTAVDDVLEQRALERRNAELSEHLTIALAAGELGTWRWDRATGITVCDAPLEKLFGLRPGEFPGTFDSWVALLHPDDAEAALAVLADALERKAPYELEHRVVWPDGTVRWVHGRGTVTLDRNGEVSGTIGCATDITERKELAMESALRARDAEQLAIRERLARERLEFLARLTEAALAGSDYRTLMETVTAAAVPRLGDWCTLYFLPEPGGTPEVEVAHRDPSRIVWAKELQERFPFDPDAATGVPAVLRTGKLEFVPRVTEELVDQALEAAAERVPREELAAVIDELRLTSVVTAPLLTKRGVIGAMQFVTAESGRVYDDEDVSLMQAAAGQIAAVLENAWWSDQHRSVAATLQSALLPPRLPVIDGISLAARYWPAGATAVGGDFYDVFPADENRWALLIGDVCGTGANAAAVTAIVRHTVRAGATHDADHLTILDWANRALHAGNRGLFCSAIYATLEPDGGGSWELTCAAGGHPLPLLARADGSVETVGKPGTLLGIFPSVKVSTQRVDLRPGDTLVLYTDGVTDLPAPYGLEPDDLAAVVREAAAGGRTAEEVAARLGRAIDARRPIALRTDDIALVVLRVVVS